MQAVVIEAYVLSSCGSLASENRLNSCGTRVPVTPQHVGSSWFRDRTCVSCIGRQILYHWATREALNILFWYYIKTQQVIVPCNQLQYTKLYWLTFVFCYIEIHWPVSNFSWIFYPCMILYHKILVLGKYCLTELYKISKYWHISLHNILKNTIH